MGLNSGILKLLFYLGLFFWAFVLYSCSKDSSSPNSLSIKISPSLISAHPGDSLDFSVSMTSGNTLSGYSVNVQVGTGYYNYLVSDGPLSGKNYSYTQGYKVPAGFVGQIVLTFEVNDGVNTQSATATINVSSNGPTFSRYRSVILGNFKDSSVGGFFASNTGSVYTQKDAASRQNNIDMVFYIGTHTLATLAAPADPGFGKGANQLDIGIQNWKIRNSTNFKSVYANDFNTIKIGWDIETAYDQGSWLEPGTFRGF